MFGDTRKPLYSKLEEYGAAKDRAALLDPLEFVTKTLPPVIKELKNGDSDAKAEDTSPKQEEEISDSDEEQAYDEPEAKQDADDTYRDKLEGSTVFELRRMLTTRKLPTIGRKAALIERLVEHRMKQSS